ncbi:two-component sensor histidine kinase [Bacillus sp. MUM 116]|uniref:ATP-binding protein n=1 Tax=Bacillus sp. MUM 116 TaxID=1678002 RepID=UPI0008F59F20|nr:ATP-binding protein [Bacillus sp. MUM 116]OIK16206.1 two-component sensor histidine kinase [Bacillus sp. MUM 116]
MLAEKLLLNLLITIAPVLILSVLSDKKCNMNSPIICGLLQSIAALTCMIFTHANYGFNWDLRYVPLVLSFLYAGPRAGSMVLGTLIVTRILMGGNTIIFGLVNMLLTALIAFLTVQKFWKSPPNKRVLISTVIGFWPLILCFVSFNTYQYFQGAPLKIDFNIPDIILIGFIHTLAIMIASKLNENVIERNKMREEIIRAEKLNTIGELAASIAHEVRNPLTVVKGFLQLMQKEEQGRKYEYLSLVLSELGRAESIINDYLNFAKPKFEKIEKFQLADVLSEVVLLLDPLAVKQGVELKSELIQSDFWLTTDRNQLKQALVNLIKNAIEATSEGGKVTIQYMHDHQNATILITDSGKGMTPEQLSKIGTLFYTTKDKGTGLGTSVSLRIIETMNGKVSYKSQPGIGTEVTMILPAVKKEVVNI